MNGGEARRQPFAVYLKPPAAELRLDVILESLGEGATLEPRAWFAPQRRSEIHHSLRYQKRDEVLVCCQHMNARRRVGGNGA
jgi:hypothetical protein